MKKSIKKIAASLLAATMVLGSMTSAFAYTTGDVLNDPKDESKGTHVGITDLEDGEELFLLAGNATGWSTDSPDAIMSAVEGREGVYSFNITAPAKTTDDAGKDTNEWARRFGILGNYCEGDAYVQGGWSRMLLGEANYKANDSYTCLSSVAIDDLEEDTKVTVYYDSRTSVIAVVDAEGNAVDYTVYWASNDRDEKGYSVDELAEMSYDDFFAGLSEYRQKELTAIDAVTPLKKTMFDGTYKSDIAGLLNYIATGEDYIVVEEPETPAATPAATTAAPTTAAATTAAPTTAAATTAKNQATQTGDVAPVALMVVLMAAVAVVAVVAKKKEA